VTYWGGSGCNGDGEGQCDERVWLILGRNQGVLGGAGCYWGEGVDEMRASG